MHQESDLMEGNPRNPSHLRVRELLVRVIVHLIIAQMCPMPCQIQVQVGQDNKRTCESLFFLLKKKIIIHSIWGKTKIGLYL